MGMLNNLPDTDPAQFLKIAAQGAALSCLLDLSGCAKLLGHCDSNAQEALTHMQTALVHGFGDGNRSGERVFAALSAQASPPAGGGTALKLLLPFIDTALRRIPPLPAPKARSDLTRMDAHA